MAVLTSNARAGSSSVIAMNSLVTVHSAKNRVRVVRAAFQHVSMVAISLAAEECANIGELIICSATFATGLSTEGMYAVSHCRFLEDCGCWLIVADLLALEPTDTMIRWYFERDRMN